jgi:DNA-binding MarR family transcriptional regulator
LRGFPLTGDQEGLSAWRAGTRSDVGGPPDKPFRVNQRDFVGPPITPSQHTVLSTLVNLCPESGSDATARQVADAADLRLGSVVVVLRSLAKRRLAMLHEGSDDHWAPTMSGRSRIRHSRAAEERQRNDDPPEGET